MWTLPSPNLYTIIVAKRVSGKNQNQVASSVDPDGTAHYEPFHLDLHCLQRLMFCSTVLNWLNRASQ